jgi:hypothetical protein
VGSGNSWAEAATAYNKSVWVTIPVIVLPLITGSRLMWFFSIWRTSSLSECLLYQLLSLWQGQRLFLAAKARDHSLHNTLWIHFPQRNRVSCPLSQ